MIIGIDLGTTNSLVSYYSEDGVPVLIPNDHSELLTPSVVSLSETGEVLVGKIAKERLITHPLYSVANVKRYMGTNKKFTLGARNFRAEELSALILRKLKKDAEAFLKTEITEAVITVPAYFNDTQRKATQAAGKLAGLTVERLINEPTAAALAYGIDVEKDAHESILVFDLGGGTFDISILEIFEGIIEVHASTGDNYLGGEDFTQAIATLIKEKLIEVSNIQIDDSDLSMIKRIHSHAERCKINYSNSQSHSIKIALGDTLHEFTLSSELIESRLRPLLDRITIPIERALRDAKISTSDISDIILVGGATNLALVRKQVTRLFGRFPNTEMDPEKVVCLGAAIQAGLKSRNKALADIVLTDVAPFTLGIATAVPKDERERDFVTGVYCPIIERNSYIPCSRSQQFFTLRDNQRVIDIEVYQGEHPRVSENLYLGKLRIRLPRDKAGKQGADVRFTYDVSGALEVEVTVLSSNEKTVRIFEDNASTMSKEDIEARFKSLEKLKLPPRELSENLVLISRAERIYQESLGDIRLIVQSRLTWFESIIEKQDERDSRRAREDFKLFLDEIDY